MFVPEPRCPGLLLGGRFAVWAPAQPVRLAADDDPPAPARPINSDARGFAVCSPSHEIPPTNGIRRKLRSQFSFAGFPADSRGHGGTSAGISALETKAFQQSRGDTRQAEYNRGPFDIATLAIFPEYLEFEGQEVLRLVVEGAAGRTVT